MNEENDLSIYIPKVHFELIPIKNLVSNQNYQRNLSLKHVQKTSANFNIYQINPVKISRREGINYVFNGQHTIETIALVSGSRETPVWCMIFDDLEYEQEADIFANQMKYTKALSAYEIFMANIEAGNDKQLLIKSLIESYDLNISSKNAPGNIAAISTIEEIFDKYGFHTLDITIRLIVMTWEGEQKSFSANMLKGVARFITAYSNEYKEDTFREKLGCVSIKELSRLAKDRHAGSLGYSEALLIFYNKRSSNGLRLEKLYSNKGKKVKNKLNDSENSSDTTMNSQEMSSAYQNEPDSQMILFDMADNND